MTPTNRTAITSDAGTALADLSTLRLLKPTEAAKLVGVPARVLSEMLYSGQISGTRVGRRMLVSLGALQRWLA
jgi:excisionase family DNA binding protein